MKIRTLLFASVLAVTASGSAQNINKHYDVPKAGTLVTQLTEAEANQITHLKLSGEINAVDFRHLRDEFIKLKELDLSEASIKAYSGKAGTHPDKFYVYMAHFIPAYAFCNKTDSGYFGKPSLRKVVLPSKVRNIEDGAFLNCNALEMVQINKNTPPNLLPQALCDTLTAIFLPEGGSDKYRVKSRWENFVFIESEPVSLTVNVADESSLENEIQRKRVQPKTINFLTVTGKLDAADFKLIRDYMPNLVAINLQGAEATEIPAFTFSHKKYLLRASLPQGLQVIGERAFSNCNRLTGILVLPNTTTAINDGAFSGCDRLIGVKSTGNTLNAIGTEIFGSNGENKLIRE